ncbi:SRPBCC family protein [Aeromicrobium endophyticum]|uniref:SRPBCC family protein n=1 Tax=Aeromicrobium endophyticum TaxID=2292704 RepID=A0A371P2L1_9ACTN|nr:SRPBCC family protein [Aeromicrobium endophyticum]REK70141.1 SRPBCC family protein [Aeromicrobium endophyticum]
MALIEIVREVPLSPAEAWGRVTAWQRHGEFVPLTRIALTPRGFDAFTGVGRIGFHDPMDVVEWREPSFCRLEKRGRVVTGWAELSVDAVAAGSRVTWREDIHVTGMPRFMDGVTKASSRALFSRVIDGLLRSAP